MKPCDGCRALAALAEELGNELGNLAQVLAFADERGRLEAVAPGVVDRLKGARARLAEVKR